MQLYRTDTGTILENRNTTSSQIFTIVAWNADTINTLILVDHVQFRIVHKRLSDQIMHSIQWVGSKEDILRPSCLTLKYERISILEGRKSCH